MKKFLLTLGILIISPTTFADSVENLLKPLNTNFHYVAPGIYRGSRPNDETIQKLRQVGFKTVINLQGGDRQAFYGAGNLVVGRFEPGEVQKNIDEEESTVQQSGMVFYNLPLMSLEGITFSESAEIQEALKIMESPEKQPVFIHCEHGKDRTGLVVALYRISYQKYSSWVAYKEMLSLGHDEIPSQLLTRGMDNFFWSSAAALGIDKFIDLLPSKL